MTQARDAAFVAGCFALMFAFGYWCRFDSPIWLAVLS